ncbi:Schizosaccharomyces specific protein [Schizosaccharomyces osmophilus]|uniref:Schizosaccharomyces specific protein n=1 Tax=Schizosaccharomyces osmophilus TaxID=2545709 RepID=A0AAE9WCW5_9SCHI|nr:Schizosaccharomyces specific protein [Schizosaccharomyces osmophilus]WBW73934.1 Schizosaccharomyces specific protein [Schizosaccharomyces osmophilus]
MKRDRPSDNGLFPEDDQISLVSPFSSYDSNFFAKRPRFGSNSVLPDETSFHQAFPPVSTSPTGSRKRSHPDETHMDEDLAGHAFVSPDNNSSAIPRSTSQLQQDLQTDGLPRKKVSLESNHPQMTTQVVDLSTGRPLERAPELESEVPPDASKSLVPYPNRLKILSFNSPCFSSTVPQFPSSSHWGFDPHLKDKDDTRLIQYIPTESRPHWTVEEPMSSDSNNPEENEPCSSVVVEELEDDYDESNDPKVPNVTTSSHTNTFPSLHNQDAMDIE